MPIDMYNVWMHVAVFDIVFKKFAAEANGSKIKQNLYVS